MSEQTQRAIVVEIATMDAGDGENPVIRELSRERYVAATIGEAVDVHAPDPAPGAVFQVTYRGRARDVR